MALRDLNTLKYTNICILSKVGADANSINSILTLGGPQNTLKNHNHLEPNVLCNLISNLA